MSKMTLLSLKNAQAGREDYPGTILETSWRNFVSRRVPGGNENTDYQEDYTAVLLPLAEAGLLEPQD